MGLTESKPTCLTVENETKDVTKNEILAEENKAPIVSPTPLELQMAEQLQEQARQLEEMKRTMEEMRLTLNPLLEEEKERNRLIAKRRAEEHRRAEEQRRIEDEKRRIEDEKRRVVAKRRAEELSRWRKAEEDRKAEEERKQRDVAEHPMRQEEARKRSAARVRSGEFSLWNHNGCEVVSKGNHVWMVDRTQLVLSNEVCYGPRLGYYMGMNFGAIHWQFCGISRNSIQHNGVTYDGTVEPKLY